jgi:type IV pilus assembly protein PilE
MHSKTRYSKKALQPRHRVLGFSLIELMATVAIIAVLGMIAIPAYRQYSMRAQRTEAKAALLQLATNQERFYLQNRTYTNNFGQLNMTGMSENSVYTLAIPVADATQYTATAVPTPGGGINGRDMTTDADCTQFSIDSQGLKQAAPDPDIQCW